MKYGIFHKFICFEIKTFIYFAGRNHVTTWSSLASTFNNKYNRKIDFDIFSNSVGLFGIKELTSANGFFILKKNLETKVNVLIKQICDHSTTGKQVIQIFDELSDCLCQVADLAEFVRNSHPHKDYCNAAHEVSSDINCLVEKLNTNQQLYLTLKRATSESTDLSLVDKYVAELFLFDFEQSGIHLSEPIRNQIVNCNENILRVSHKFFHGTFQPQVIPQNKVSDELKKIFPSDGLHILIDSFHSDCPDESVREAAYKLYLFPNEIQEYYLSMLLDERYKLAELCGFKSYAHRTLNGTVANTPMFVNDFLIKLSKSLDDFAGEDFFLMKMLKKNTQYINENVQMWDICYLTHVAKQKYFRTEILNLESYFSLGFCMQGLNILLKKLYGIHFQLEETQPGEIWNENVQKLAGFIYCDFFEREGKPNQDCHFTIRGTRLLPDGSYQLPIVVVMLNLQLPTAKQPCLLFPLSLDNLFHEMGHALHSILACTPYQHVSGTRCTTDLAEVPSALMEHFSNDPRILSTFAFHYQSQEKLQWDSLVKMCAAKHLFAASEMQLQVLYSLLDQSYHDCHPPSKMTTKVLEDLQKCYFKLPYVTNTAWQFRFSHLAGYGAKYYSYLVSRAIAAAIWESYFKKDPFNGKSGHYFRNNFLRYGGSQPPNVILSKFLNKLTPDTLVDALMSEVRRSHFNYKQYITQ